MTIFVSYLLTEITISLEPLLALGKWVLLSEDEYYRFVEEFVQKEFNCMRTGTNKGNLALGLVDVLGAYETSGDFYSDIEIVSVEVKTTTSSFGKSIGQSLGYSIFGERCYLATTFETGRTYSPEQMFIGGHLGVGLIRIEVDSDMKPVESRIGIALTSKKHAPIPSQKALMMNSLGIASCVFCGIYGPKEQMQSIKRKTGAMSVFSQKGTRRLHACGECYQSLISEIERNKSENRSNRAKRAIETRKRRIIAANTPPIDGGIAGPGEKE